MDTFQLHEAIDRRQDELLELVQTLIQFETPSPPARNTADAQQYIASYLANYGFSIDTWDVYPGDPNVVATKHGSKSESYQSLLLNGHIDVAAVEEDEPWTTPPFSASIRHGYLYGRGAADMKGGLGTSLFLLKLFDELNIKLGGDLLLHSVVGEEVGEAGTKQCLERGHTADFAIVCDTSDCHMQGQGGVITGWITVKSPTTHHDGTRRQMIHAGGGVHGASAIEKMMTLIESLQVLERHWAVTKSHPGFPAGTTTINPAVIEGGRHPAFIADECSLWITVHYYPNESHETVTAEIEEAVLARAQSDPWLKEHPPTFRWGGTSMIEDRGEIFPALPIDPHWEALPPLRDAHRQAFGTALKEGMSTSVTDGGWLAEGGVPAVIYGPGQMKHAHSVDERIRIDDLLTYTKSLATFILTWCNTKKET
ncbi:acetylornithine deacetylase [Shouchella shacheensis]|uniref:acetylornithine deacetylase n=1 Tax=Shouchella shacheensis TaxID=1649580 RepID=UPI0007404FD3|nr:acetylornithine deacetylase [Shouchella shacheensis]